MMQMAFGMFGRKRPKFDPEKEQNLRDEIKENGGLDKKDLPAMIFSAYLVFLPIAIGILLLIALIAFLFLGFH